MSGAVALGKPSRENMQAPQRFTAVFGGAFDPVHLGHVAVVRALSSRPEIGRILVVPSLASPHKAISTKASHRTKMCELAFLGFKKVEVSRCEAVRVGISYTVDTLRLLSRENPAEDLALVVGEDTFRALPSWKNFKEITKAVKILVLPRGFAAQAKTRPLKEAVEEMRSLGGVCEVLKFSPIDISSSEVREKLCRKAVVGELLPKAVRVYIEENKLYKC